jgi:DNA-directed RNA polymerase II subunit RPB3
MPNQRFPKFEILSVQPHEIKFILSETDTSMANSLRRIMIAEVPTLTIDLVEFSENSTVLNDEYIAHRLGLIPLRYQPVDTPKGLDCSDVFTYHRDCVCHEHCARCSVEFDLDCSYSHHNAAGGAGGGDAADDVQAPLTITSRDLISNNESVQPAHFASSEELENAHDMGISIVKICSGQRLKLKAIARLGIAKEHAKWSPVAVATYRFWPEIEINEEQMSLLTMEQKQTLIDACPDRILELDELSGEVRPVANAWELATYTEDLDFAQRLLKKRPEDDDFVKIRHSTNKFIFSVESTGSMDADEILTGAMKVLKKRLNMIARELESIKEMGQ